MYWWIATAAYSFMLEMFVFISGYVWAFQLFERKKSQSFKQLVGAKFKRLIIPSLIFSIAYVILLGSELSSAPKLIYAILSGYGHMWFLPMLFWCFVGVYIIEKIQIKEEYKLFLLLLCSMVSFLPLPFGLQGAMYYIFFFYAGFYLRKRLADGTIDISKLKLVLLWVIFIATFIALTLVRRELRGDISNNILIKAFAVSGSKVCQIIYAGLGIVAMYCTVRYIANKCEVKQWIVKLGEYCFGVYLFQQFILMGLYYHTNLPTLVGSDWLPWIGTAIALSGSLLLSWLFRKTKIGRALI